MKPRTLQIHLQKELSRLYDAHEAAAIATRYVTDRFGLSTAQLLHNDDVLLCGRRGTNAARCGTAIGASAGATSGGV